MFIDPDGRDTIPFTSLINQFNNLNVNHKDPKKGTETYNNHCAINLSEAIIESGQRLDKYSGKTCTNCSDRNKKHALLAQELADWMIKNPKSVGAKGEVMTGENWQEKVNGRKGIIFFQDYWQRENETGNTRTGDHIDVWNMNEMESKGFLRTWIRQTFPQFSEDYLDMSDLNKSKKVIFWELKD